MVKFTGCPADRVPDLLRFFGAMYSPDHILAKSEPFLRWQYGGTNRPGDGTLTVNLALVDDHIAGCVGYIPVELQVNGGSVAAAWAANLMVDDRYRRLGLGPLLMRELMKQFEVTLALGGNRAAHDLLPRMGWTDLGDLPRFVCVVDPSAAALLTETGAIDWPGDLVDLARSHRPAAGIARIGRFNDAATDAWAAAYHDSAGTRRSAEFLNWRYASHPLFEYRIFRHTDAGAFAVYRIEQARDVPVRIGRIVELVGADDVALDLLQAIELDGVANGVAVFDLFCSSRRIPAVAAAAGFLSGDPRAAAIPLLFQPVDRSRTDVLFMADLQRIGGAPPAARDWYVTTADDDQDRPN